MQGIPMLLPSLVLLLTAGLCHCLVQCPLECRGTGWIIVPGKVLEIIEGPKVQAILTVIKKLQKIKPGTTTVKVTIGGRDLRVPSGTQFTILDTIKKFPDIGQTLTWIIKSSGASGQPPTENQKPWFPEDLVPDIFKTSSSPSNPTSESHQEVPEVPEVPNVGHIPRPVPYPVEKPLSEARLVSEPPHVSEISQVPEAPQAPEAPQVPKANQVLEVPKVPEAPQVHEVSEVPEISEVPELPKDTTPFDVESYLDLLQKNPDLFVLVYWMLVRHGVTFPNLSKPVTWVIVNGKRVPLQKPVTVRYIITIENHKFELPRDTKKFADFISKNPNLLPQIATILQQFGATLVTTANGQITGYKLFNKVTRLRRPVKATVTINGRVFELPRDIVDLIGAVQDSPKSLHMILPLLTSYGVRIKKGPNGEIHYLTLNGKTYPVEYVKPVKVTIDNIQFSIPADLSVILSQPSKLWIGQLLSELQKQHVPITVDPQTGNLVGIVIDQVPIPFPAIVRLRVKLENRYFIIPRDIPAMIDFLKTRGLPSEVLNDLYSLYGIIPVRNADKLVVAIEFNGKRYPVPQQKTTTLVVADQTFVLPRDNAKLAEILVNHKIPIKAFLLQIQLAGYKLLAGPDGVLSSVQKGFEIFELPVTIRLVVTINNDRYRIPNDLPNLVDFMSKPEHSHVVEQIVQNLIELGVQVKRDGGKIVLVFNGREFNVKGEGGPFPQPGPMNVPGESTMRIQFNGQWFKIPDEFDSLVTTVRKGGTGAIAFLVKALAEHGILVNRSSDGNIVSIVFRGKTYTFPRGTSAGPSNVEVVIRGQKFLIPRDLGVLPTQVRNFQYGELVVALHRLGISLAVDDRGNFFGMKVGGKLVRFGVTFRVAVILDNSGTSFGVPHQLGALAGGLANGNWDWNAVRRVLYASGVEVRGGVAGAPREIGFQGTFYKIQSGIKG
ncbi:unnamed protein product [Ixodes persulcatus]